ncbi:unnamed protein product, partial [Ectocarpus fasciculatus]
GEGDDLTRAPRRGGRELLFLAKRSFKVSGTLFELDAMYELIKPIGLGAYGVVVSALNTENGEKVAIKKITKAFDDLVDAKRILREITLLRKFDHENIINIVDILVPPSPEEFEDVYIVSNLMETDLHRIINSKQELTPEHVQYFIYQILRALKYMHSSNVLHRDLKPSNLLLNSNCELKVCDLGLARDIESGCKELTEYVVTRWYRAPEIMLGCHEYSKAIDVWSVGCIFAELMLRRPFFPGDHYIDQLKIICNKMGKPKEDELAFVSTEKARRFIMKLSATTPQRLRDQFPGTASDEALDLLAKMLEFSPETRISVEDALKHPFMQSYHTGSDEPSADFEFCFSFEAEVPTKHRLQELMWEEMRRYHPEQGKWKGKTRPPAAAAAKLIGSPRNFGHLKRDTAADPLGRSPIKASPVNSEAPNSSVSAVDIPPPGGGASASSERHGEPPAEGGPKKSRGLASRAACSARPQTRRTSKRVAAAAAAAVAAAQAAGAPSNAAAVSEGRNSTPEGHRGLATVPVIPTPTSAPYPPSSGSSSLSSSSASGDPLGVAAAAPRARTRATARARVIKGRTTACPMAYSSSGSSCGEKAAGHSMVSATPDADSFLRRWTQTAAPVAAVKSPNPEAVAANKRQRKGQEVDKKKGRARTLCAEPGRSWPATTADPLCPTGIKPIGSGGNSISGSDSGSGGGGSGSGNSCRQGAPANGSSEFLSKAGFGDDSPSQTPSFAKRKLVDCAGKAGKAGSDGGVVPGTKHTAISDRVT